MIRLRESEENKRFVKVYSQALVHKLCGKNPCPFRRRNGVVNADIHGPWCLVCRMCNTVENPGRKGDVPGSVSKMADAMSISTG